MAIVPSQQVWVEMVCPNLSFSQLVSMVMAKSVTSRKVSDIFMGLVVKF